MTFREWKFWVASLPWPMKWFVCLVLIRPLIDVLYFLKEISPVLSPLYIVGVLTPACIIVSLASPKMPRGEQTFLDVIIHAWGFVLFMNCILMLTLEITLESLQLITKQVTPYFLIVYLRRFVRSKRELMGLLTTFLYSTAFPFLMQLYERFIGPIGPTVETRGHERFEGLFADVVSYAIYIMGALLIAGYFFLGNKGGKDFRKRATVLSIIGVLAIMGLVTMHHTASWMVAAVLMGVLCFYSLKRGQLGTIVFLGVLLVVGYIGFGEAISDRLGAALQTDLAVLEGEKEVDRAFHGRMWRWKILVGYWMEKPLMDKFLGLSVSSLWIEYPMLGSGIHNDFMRIICVTGLLGFFFYLMYYAVLFQRSLALRAADQFLVLGSMLIILMYSITTTPTLYPPLLYLVFSIFAYGTLPRKGLKYSPRPLSSLNRSSRHRKIHTSIHV